MNLIGYWSPNLAVYLTTRQNHPGYACLHAISCQPIRKYSRNSQEFWKSRKNWQKRFSKLPKNMFCFHKMSFIISVRGILCFLFLAVAQLVNIDGESLPWQPQLMVQLKGNYCNVALISIDARNINVAHFKLTAFVSSISNMLPKPEKQ